MMNRCPLTNRPALRSSLALAAALLTLGVLLGACGGSDGDNADDLPSDPGDGIERVRADFATLEEHVPGAIENRGDVRNTELADALVDIIAICRRAESMDESDPAEALRRACDRFIYAGMIRSMAGGNALFLLDGVNQAKAQLTDYQ